MELNSIKDAFDRVAKKQKLYYSKTQEMMDQIHQDIQKALMTIEECPTNCSIDHKAVLTELKEKLQQLAPLTQLEGVQKELNAALSKYPKVLEKHLNPDISKACRNIEFDTHTVNQIVASHFYRQGLFDVGDRFIMESGEPESVSVMRPHFQEMYRIIEAMKNRDLGPALSWAARNSEQLKQNSSDLKLKLHSLQFVEIVQSGSREEALSYARAHISPFSEEHMPEIQKLMTCLLWAGRLSQSPYAELLSPTHWAMVAKDLVGEFCNILGQSQNSPLSVTVSAGIQGLPPLLKFMTVMAGKKHEWQTMDQLPVPVELSPEFQFHSVFVCPVSKEQSTDDNPPMLMPCGHVLCKQSINKMSKNGSKQFKCPYCPSDIDSTRCRQLYF